MNRTEHIDFIPLPEPHVHKRGIVASLWLVAFWLAVSAGVGIPFAFLILGGN